ncbi:hypothetical protein HK098_002278 [Nowakowskiella sp. JEL0407]|nr:hypothetical protein HK098_002278 [Nowakowskiella sp. JEL0407]
MQWATSKPAKPRVAVDSVADALKREMPKFEKEIKKHMFTEVFKNGAYIIKKHAIGKEMCFIVKGKVEVVSGDGSIVYSTIHRGSFLERNMTAVAPAPENHLLSGQVHLQLLPHTENPDHKPTLKELIDRKLKEGTPIRIGRQVIKDGQVQGRAANPILSASDIWFTSKVVSRNHAEMWVKDGQLYIKDIGSSSGTFLNKMRLSPSGKESRPYPIKEGDTLQFGIDYKGKQEDIYKSIIVKIGFYDNSWMRQQKKNSNPVRFKQALKALLAATNPYANTKDETVVDDGGSTDCCICIGAIGPYQALFIAPCSHCYHYKCVAGLLSVSQMFQCPLCRQVANLAASVSMESLYDSQDDVDKTEDEAGSKHDDDKISDTGSDHSYDENRERKVYPKEKAPVHEIRFPFVTGSNSDSSEQHQNARPALIQSNDSISSSGNGGGEQNRSRNSSLEPQNKWGRRKSGNSSPDPSYSPGKDKTHSSITNKITNIFGRKSHYGEPSLTPNNGTDATNGLSPRQTKREVTNHSTKSGEDSLRRSRSAEILNQ